MKKVCKYFGTFLLSLASMVVITGVASLGGMATEEIPDYIKNKR
ncbi:MAG: hypothetical protein ACERKV_09195 [Clostridiaceae bacterium]